MGKTIITKEELIKAREDLMNMAIDREPKQRKIFTGDTAVLLVGNKLVTSEIRQHMDAEQLAKRPNDDFLNKMLNYSCDDYLGALMYTLHQKTGCHIIFGYNQLNDDYHRWARHKRIDDDFIKDEELVRFIKGNHIQIFTRLKMTDGQSSDNLLFSELETREFNSSYNYGGMTNFSDSLGKMAQGAGFKSTQGFATAPFKEALIATGSRFSDERIEAYARVGHIIGVLLNRGLTPEEIWPYTMDAFFKVNTNPDFDQMITVFNILYEHILFTQKEIKKHGMEYAFKLPKRG